MRKIDEVVSLLQQDDGRQIRSTINASALLQKKEINRPLNDQR